MQIRDHVPLRETCQFKTGGVTEYYVACATLAELLEAVKQAVKLKVSFRVIGEGSAVLMSDAGFPGLIIQNQSSGMLFIHERSQVMVEAGTPLRHVITKMLSLGYSGLEFLAGAPGTIGGAVYRNISAFGSSMSDYVKSATILFPDESGEAMKRVDREWFEFSYRSSKLKQRQSFITSKAPIILSVTLQLSKASSATCLQKANTYFRWRQETRPKQSMHLHVFDTLCLKGKQDATITSLKPETRHLHFVDKNQVRQWKLGDISLSIENPNYLINSGMGTSREAASLITSVVKTVGTELAPLESIIEHIGLWDDTQASD